MEIFVIVTPCTIRVERENVNLIERKKFLLKKITTEIERKQHNIKKITDLHAQQILDLKEEIKNKSVTHTTLTTDWQRNAKAIKGKRLCSNEI